MSEMFEEIFASGGSGIVRLCVCGTTHFSVESSDRSCYEEDEFEELEEKSKEFPSKFVAQPFCIGTMIINGNEIVIGCRCGVARRYEDFLINDGHRIATYLNKRAEKLKAEAESITIPYGTCQMCGKNPAKKGGATNMCQSCIDRLEAEADV